MQLNLLARASNRKDDLHAMFRDFLTDSSQALDGKINVIAAQEKIMQCLGLDQAEEARVLLVLLLLWSSGDGYLPVAAIFRMLQLVSIDKLHRQQVRQLCVST